MFVIGNIKVGSLVLDTAPTVSDIVKSIAVGTALAFAELDFSRAFSDVDNDALQKVIITALPQHGTLTLGNDAVARGEEIPVFLLGSLHYTPAPEYTGADAFAWQGSDGNLYAVAAAPVNLTVTQILTVTNANDSGSGSLRQAIIDANERAGADTIQFAISTGAQTIALLSPLPALTDPVNIDGTTQPGFFGRPIIELNGARAGSNVDGLVISTSSSIVRGVVINGFDGFGIVLTGSSAFGDTLSGDYIGTDLNGVNVLANSKSGIGVNNGAHGNLIGTDANGFDDLHEANVISGNGFDGIAIEGSGSDDNVVAGNYIGTDYTGTVALKSNHFGVKIVGGARFNRVGVQGLNVGRNIISGNLWDGVFIGDAGSDNNIVAGNFIGIDVTGTQPLGNNYGVRIDNGARFNRIGTDPNGILIAAEGNVISGNRNDGILVTEADTKNNTITGNWIGTDRSGTMNLGNAWSGVSFDEHTSGNLVGGTQPAAGNTIAFNGSDGVAVLSGTGNAILGNSIFSNTSLGIELKPNGEIPGPNNLQNFPTLTSALTTTDGTTIQGSLVGTPNASVRVEFFANALADSSGYGEGQTFLGFTRVTLDQFGNGDFTFTTPAVTTNQIISSTATDDSGNTSDFSVDLVSMALSQPWQLQLSDLREQYGFVFPGDFYQSYGGYDAKWILDRTHSQWLVIFPDGTLDRWGGIVNGKDSFNIIATLNPQVWSDPNLLLQADLAQLATSTDRYEYATLRHRYGFTSSGNYYESFNGLHNKWIQDSAGAWYALDLSGTLKKWGGTVDGVDSFSTIPTTYSNRPLIWDDPGLLLGADLSLLLTQADNDQLDKLRQQFGFYSNGKYSQSYNGLDAKWFLDSTGVQWYALFRDGSLKKWNGFANGADSFEVVAAGPVNPVVWDDPKLLLGASLSLSVSAERNLTALSQANGFHFGGTYYSNWLNQNLNEKWFLDGSNHWYYITNQGVIFKGDGTKFAQVDVRVWDDPNLLFEAKTAMSAQAQVSWLRQQYGFTFAGGYYSDYHGLAAKWFLDRWGAWYVLRTDGSLQFWKGFTNGVDYFSTIALLDPQVWADPYLLFGA